MWRAPHTFHAPRPGKTPGTMLHPDARPLLWKHFPTSLSPSSTQSCRCLWILYLVRASQMFNDSTPCPLHQDLKRWSAVCRLSLTKGQVFLFPSTFSSFNDYLRRDPSTLALLPQEPTLPTDRECWQELSVFFCSYVITHINRPTNKLPLAHPR